MLSKIKPGLLSGIGWEENMAKGNSVTENLPQRKKKSPLNRGHHYKTWRKSSEK